MPFRFKNLEIPGLVQVNLEAFGDDRGFFMEMYKHSEFAANGVPPVFVQDNYSHSVKGVIRGLHYQRHPKVQGKLVMLLHGVIFDVSVDIRLGSPTYGKWNGIIMAAKDCLSIYVPVGFAHGFCVLSEEAGVLYKVTEEYGQEYEGGIVWNDPDLAIQWPIATPLLSEKDARLPRLRDTDHNFNYKGGV
jgi:dTDP-4-dehydrorhamnose 3,5-epimerase